MIRSCNLPRTRTNTMDSDFELYTQDSAQGVHNISLVVIITNLFD